MNIERPHEIVDLDKIKVKTTSELKSKVYNGRQWMHITNKEEEILSKMTEDERHEWFSKLPLHEKLRRIQIAEEDINLHQDKNPSPLA